MDEELAVSEVHLHLVVPKDGRLEELGQLSGTGVTAVVANGDTVFVAAKTGHLFWMRWTGEEEDEESKEDEDMEGPCPLMLPQGARSGMALE